MILLLCECEVEICVSRAVMQPLILLLDTCAYIKYDFGRQMRQEFFLLIGQN